MFRWLKEYTDSNSQTKYFTLNAIVYGLALIITSIYCYGRLDFVRSYQTPVIGETIEKKALQKNNPE
jgi:hypothetical protein